MMRVLALDIECAPALVWSWGLFNQNHSIGQVKEPPRMLSLSARWHGSKKNMFFSEHHNGRKEMLEAIHGLLDEATHVIHWNGKRFDIPWINGELAKEGFGPPSPYKQVDLMLQSRRNFRFLSQKLQWVSERQFGLAGKVSHDGFPLWLRVMEGDERAWNTFRRYNKQDVDLLIELYDQMLPWLSGINANLYNNDASEDACPNCGSTDLQWRGWAYTAVSEYPRFQCKRCSKWGRGTRRTRGVATQEAKG